MAAAQLALLPLRRRERHAGLRADDELSKMKAELGMGAPAAEPTQLPAGEEKLA